MCHVQRPQELVLGWCSGAQKGERLLLASLRRRRLCLVACFLPSPCSYVVSVPDSQSIPLLLLTVLPSEGLCCTTHCFKLKHSCAALHTYCLSHALIFPQTSALFSAAKRADVSQWINAIAVEDDRNKVSKAGFFMLCALGTADFSRVIKVRFCRFVSPSAGRYRAARFASTLSLLCCAYRGCLCAQTAPCSGSTVFLHSVSHGVPS